MRKYSRMQFQRLGKLMAKRRKHAAAGATLLHPHRATEARAAAHTPATAALRGRRTLGGFKVTTIRLTDPQWAWLRRQALERAIESGRQADASEIVRELVAAAMMKNGRA